MESLSENLKNELLLFGVEFGVDYSNFGRGAINLPKYSLTDNQKSYLEEISVLLNETATVSSISVGVDLMTEVVNNDNNLTSLEKNSILGALSIAKHSSYL